jgi:hypothetical protein
MTPSQKKPPSSPQDTGAGTGAFRLEATNDAAATLVALEADKSQATVYKAIAKCLGYMQTNLRHSGLQTHKIKARKAPDGSPVFESYAQNHTAGAWRIFWHYGPGAGVLTILMITEHP